MIFLLPYTRKFDTNNCACCSTPNDFLHKLLNLIITSSVTFNRSVVSAVNIIFYWKHWWILVFPFTFKLKVELLLEYEVVGNKAEGRISKTGVTRKQSPSNFPKNDNFLPLDTHVHVGIKGQEMLAFWKIWRALFPCNIPFAICPFALLLTKSKP